MRIDRNPIMQTSILSHFPFVLHPPLTQYSFFFVSKKSALNSIRAYLRSFFNPQSPIPHSFRGKITKSDFYSPACLFPLQIRRIWGGCPKGGWGCAGIFVSPFVFQETNAPFITHHSSLIIHHSSF